MKCKLHYYSHPAECDSTLTDDARSLEQCRALSLAERDELVAPPIVTHIESSKVFRHTQHRSWIYHYSRDRFAGGSGGLTPSSLIDSLSSFVWLTYGGSLNPSPVAAVITSIIT